MLFPKFKKGEQAKLLKSLKKKTGFGWAKVANTLQVGRSMVFLYLNEKCKIPQFRIMKLCHLANEILGKNIEFVEDTTNEEKQIREPRIGEGLSEFLGILSGDGSLGTNNYDVSITCGLFWMSNISNKMWRRFLRSCFSLSQKYG